MALLLVSCRILHRHGHDLCLARRAEPRVTELTTSEYDVQDLATWIFGLLVTQLVQALADNYANFKNEAIALDFMVKLKNLIYKKSLKLSTESRRLKSTGDITNLCKSDTEMILIAALYVHQLWIMPLRVLVGGVMQYRLLGLASLVGFGIIGLTFDYLSARFMGLYLEVVAWKDERAKAVTEVFTRSSSSTPGKTSTRSRSTQAAPRELAALFLRCGRERRAGLNVGRDLYLVLQRAREGSHSAIRVERILCRNKSTSRSALHSIVVSVHRSEKLEIVGRTGAGKWRLTKTPLPNQ